ncbi:MAG: TlpA family protein disulfide reductase [Fimbriimonadaceae bacterium]|nr:TlpA family protein disulfide reductase [Fimbriimonadaceae bacterium]
MAKTDESVEVGRRCVATGRWRRGAVIGLPLLVLLGLAGFATLWRAQDSPQRLLRRLEAPPGMVAGRIRGVVRLEVVASGSTTSVQQNYSASWAAPNLLRLECGEGAQRGLMVCDGRHVWLQVGSDQVARCPAPADWTAWATSREVQQTLRERSTTPAMRELLAAHLTCREVVAGIDPQSEWMRQLPPVPGRPVTATLPFGPRVTWWIGRQQPHRMACEIPPAQLQELLRKYVGADAEMPKAMALGFRVLLTFTECRLLTQRPADLQFQYHLAARQRVVEAAGPLDLAKALLDAPDTGRAVRDEPSKLLGKPLPEFEARTLEGRRVSSRSLRGRPLVLDLWATWCPPCRAALPRLERLHQQHRSAGLQVVALSVDSRPVEVQAFLKRQPQDLTVWHLSPASQDHDRLAQALHLAGIPRTLYVDRRGIIREDATGLHSEAAMRAALRKIGIR